MKLRGKGMRYLGVDLGSSFIKGAVLDLDELALGRRERIPFPEPIAGQNTMFREYDPRQVVAATRALLEKLLQQAPDAGGVVMCSQLHGLVFTSAQGQEMSNFISWQDQRALLPLEGAAGTYFDEINRRITAQERAQLGNEPRPGLPLCFLFWLEQNHALPREPAVPAPLANYVIANLCRSKPGADLTNAFAHGALNLVTRDWHWEVIEKLGLKTVCWPEIVPQGAAVGEGDIGGRRLTFYAPVGDYQCSQAGVFLEEVEMSINISTGSAVIQLAQGLEFGDFQTRPFFDGRFLRTITHLPAGRALNVLIRLLSELAEAQGLLLRDPWDYILRQADRAGDTDLRVNPAFYFSAMGNQGEITNATEDNLTVGHLFRAAFTGMAENYVQCARRIAPTREWLRIVFSGGVALKIELLRRLICERLGKESRLAACEEDTLLGLLVLALAFSGQRASVADAMAFARKNYQPESSYGSLLPA
ncbi:MAG: hypothetical protein KGJ60_07890 [Verrucomicrobiota bacterium]|nr:hypothetical protein [Verrucomicrobiota bacterium]